MNKAFKSLLCALSLMLALTACQVQPEQPAQSEPVSPVIEFIRTSIQVQSDNSYAIWEHTADNSRLRLSTYNAQGYLQYRIDYRYDEQGRIVSEETLQLLEDQVSTISHTNSYNYTGSEVEVSVSDFSYADAVCRYTMSDPAHRVNIKDIAVANETVEAIVLEEVDLQGNQIAEERIVPD